MPTRYAKVATAALLLLGLTACQQEASEPEHSTAPQPARIEALREAFDDVDWQGLTESALEEQTRWSKANGIVIDPPNEHFVRWMAQGPIETAALDDLLRSLEAKARDVVASQSAEVESRYDVTEIPNLVADAVVMSDKRPLPTCKGFGLAVRCGNVLTHIEVLATPLDDEWRLDGYLRDPTR